MGYFNPMMQYGIEKFCQRCETIGIDGLIIPDLPVDVYHEKYKNLFDRHGLYNMFLITPQTSDERIRYIDQVSNGFIYMVSSAAVTGAQNVFGAIQTSYFERIENMNLITPTVVGFGISNAATYTAATTHSKGAIIGSAFIKFLEEKGIDRIESFIKTIKG
ncbi:MAG: tryptophan synthase subunit alpha, partial [Flavobacteriaceae bacterium]|nr:tryptophan synthase subunit alpha [Flavobacteriaceae bacterium]